MVEHRHRYCHAVCRGSAAGGNTVRVGKGQQDPELRNALHLLSRNVGALLAHTAGPSIHKVAPELSVFAKLESEFFLGACAERQTALHLVVFSLGGTLTHLRCCVHGSHMQAAQSSVTTKFLLQIALKAMLVSLS